MDRSYPHWYHDEPCVEGPMDEMCCEEKANVYPYPGGTLKDRLLCMLGNEVIFSVDASICGRSSLVGVLCYVGCDFIIVNSVIRCKRIPLHIPINMIRLIAPYKCRK